MKNTVLILGASGKIGAHAAAAFKAAGWEIRKYVRSAGNMVQAAQGVDVIVNGLNPPAYHDWENLIPAITRQVIEAAKASGAMVILPGNVYNFGERGGEWSEDTPHHPNTRKGKIRCEMEDAYRASGVQTLVLRAGNFIDPDRNGDVMSVLLMRGILRGKVTAAGDPNTMQAYCYLPDWARAAVQLAEMRDRLARFEDVPFPGHSFTVEELRRFLSGRLGRPIGISAFPWWVMWLLSPFWELARELREMRYLWSTSHTLSGRKLSALLPKFVPTPQGEVMLAGLPPEMRREFSEARRGTLQAGDDVPFATP